MPIPGGVAHTDCREGAQFRTVLLQDSRDGNGPRTGCRDPYGQRPAGSTRLVEPP